jgi:hypothetical protein
MVGNASKVPRGRYFSFAVEGCSPHQLQKMFVFSREGKTAGGTSAWEMTKIIRMIYVPGINV